MIKKEKNRILDIISNYLYVTCSREEKEEMF